MFGIAKLYTELTTDFNSRLSFFEGESLFKTYLCEYPHRGVYKIIGKRIY